MATDISQIKALDDFPSTPYKNTAQAICLRFRWIHGQCFQFELPNGKTLMTDPFFPQNRKAWTRETTPMLDLDTLGRIDYVTINHPHFDHMDNLKDVFGISKPLVICDGLFARELSAVYEIPSFSIFPIVTGQSYHFDSFELQTIHGSHNDIGDVCDLEGRQPLFFDPDRPLFGRLNSYGSMFNTSYMFTLTNNYRIGFAAGVDVSGMAEAWRKNGPDLLLRQRLVYASPEEYADDCAALGGQLILPMHHDACFDCNSDMNAYAEDVNTLLAVKAPHMKMFTPQRMKWYSIFSGVS